MRKRFRSALDVGTDGFSGHAQESAANTAGGKFALVYQATNGALGDAAQLPGDFFQRPQQTRFLRHTSPCPEIGGMGPVDEKTEHTKAAEHGSSAVLDVARFQQVGTLGLGLAYPLEDLLADVFATLVTSQRRFYTDHCSFVINPSERAISRYLSAACRFLG